MALEGNAEEIEDLPLGPVGIPVAAVRVGTVSPSFTRVFTLRRAWLARFRK